MITVHTLPILDDNYTFILEAQNGDVALVDPGDADAILDYLYERNLTPDAILITHHHHDHIGGLTKLKNRFDCMTFGPAAEAEKIGDLTITLTENSTLSFGGEKVDIIETPGHTLGHIAFHFSESGLLFCGDTLFIMGCGRVFEGTMTQMYQSLQKLAVLPDDTKVYCGHEYSLANAEFLKSTYPDDTSIQARFKQIKSAREENIPTVPGLLSVEKTTNSFLNAKNAQEFETLRRLKDNF